MNSTTTIRQRIDQGFERWGRWVALHAWLTLALSCAVVLGVGSMLRFVTFDTHPEKFLAEDHPVRESYSAFKNQFGLDDSIIIAVRPDDMFAPEFLEWLRNVHNALEDAVPHLDEVTSLINARLTRSEGDTLIVEDLMEDWPESPSDFETLRSRANGNAVYENLLLSQEFGLTMIVVDLSPYGSQASEDLGGFDDEGDLSDTKRQFLTGAQRLESVEAALGVLEAFPHPGLETHVVGSAPTAHRVLVLSRQNAARFTGLSILAIILVLGVLFRRVSGMVIPIGVGLMAVVVAFGYAGLRGSPLNITVQTVPSLLIAVSVAAAVHLFVLFYRAYDGGADKTDAIAEAFEHSGLPVVASALTTAAGLIAFTVSDVQALRDVGQLAPVGIVASLLLTLTFLPAVLSLAPLARKKRVGEEPRERDGRLERVLVALAGFSVRRPWTVVAASALVVLVLGSGMMRLQYQFDPLLFLPEDDPFRVSTELLNKELAGVTTVEFVIDTGRENGLHDPEVLEQLSELHTSAAMLKGGRNGGLSVGKTLSFVDILREINQALNENQPSFYSVPQTRQLAAQELLLFENSGADDLEEFVDSTFSKARFTLRVPWVSPSDYGSFLPDAAVLFQNTLGPDVEIQVTGLVHLLTVVQEELWIGSYRSYTIALAIISLLMVGLVGNVRGGLIAMIPNLAPIVVVLGVLGWLSGELNLFTLLVGGIAIGMAVDDTIHVVHQFHRYMEKTGDIGTSIELTMRTTGMALLTTSIVLSLGFLVFTFSTMRNLDALGLLTASAVVCAFLADIVLAPALLTLMARREATEVR